MEPLKLTDFETPPLLGDTVKIQGKVKSISENGDVELDYDHVEVMPKEDEKEPKDAGEALDKYMAEQADEGDNAPTQ